MSGRHKGVRRGDVRDNGKELYRKCERMRGRKGRRNGKGGVGGGYSATPGMSPARRAAMLSTRLLAFRTLSGKTSPTPGFCDLLSAAACLTPCNQVEESGEKRPRAVKVRLVAHHLKKKGNGDGGGGKFRWEGMGWDGMGRDGTNQKQHQISTLRERGF